MSCSRWFSTIRRVGSTVYPLTGILALVVAGLLAGQTSVLAIAEWGALGSGAAAPGGVADGLPITRMTLSGPCSTPI